MALSIHGSKTRRYKIVQIAVVSIVGISLLAGGYAGAQLMLQEPATSTNTEPAEGQPQPPAAPDEVSESTEQIEEAPPEPKRDYTIPPIENGLAPVISRIPTELPVVFLGIDDGAYKADFELQMMKDNNVKASLFLSQSSMGNNPDFFKAFIDEGSLVENHTLDHLYLPGLSYQQQKQQICGQADLQKEQFGRRSVLFRPPYGAFNEDTRRAAADCGMKAIINWIAKANGGSMQYQIGNGLESGDIVLMHFRPEFKEDMQAFLDAQNAAGLHTELLTDWLP